MERDFVDCPQKSDCQQTIRCCDCEVYAHEQFNIPPSPYYYDEDDLNQEDEGDIDDEDEPCGNLYAPGSEECDWCKWSEQCEEDLGIFLRREEKLRKK